MSIRHLDFRFDQNSVAVIGAPISRAAGLGRRLMGTLIAHLRSRGMRRPVATVLAENRRMLALARALGCRVETAAGEPGVRRVVLDP